MSYYKNIFSGVGSELGISGRLPPVLAVLPQDMARLLGNALEACKGCTVSPKIVKAEFTYDKGFLSIRVTNPYENAPKRTGGRLRSTKPDGDKHGYGMAIMEELAKEYGGGIFHDAKDGVFILRIILRDRDI